MMNDIMILISGSLAYDRIMNFDGRFSEHIDPKKLHVLSVSFTAHRFKENFGGTAGNIAYNLALLGEKPRIISAAGSDFAPYGKWLRAKGIELDLVQRVKNEPTASAYIMTDQADCQITAFYPGSMNVKCKMKNVKCKSIIKNSKLAIVAAGNIGDMKELPRLYKKFKIPYIYDPGQAIPALAGNDLIAGLTGAKVFICNDYELTMVLKKTGLTKRQLLNRVEVLITTLGEKGSLIEVQSPKSKVQSHRIPAARPKNTSDPTGAGDAYRAGLIKGLLMGLPYDKIGKLASVVSVYTVEKYGTQTHYFTWPQLLKRYQENFREDLF